MLPAVTVTAMGTSVAVGVRVLGAREIWKLGIQITIDVIEVPPLVLAALINTVLTTSTADDSCGPVGACPVDDNAMSAGSADDKKLSPGEIKKLKGKGIDPEALKGGKRTGQRDLFKDKKGNVFVKPKDGTGPGDPTGVNINDP
jgi:hypothetical protein